MGYTTEHRGRRPNVVVPGAGQLLIVESKYELMTREPQTNCKKAFYGVFLH